MKQKAYIAMPTLHGRPDVATMASVIETMCGLQAAGIPVKFKPVPGDSIISRTRNFFVADFLASDCTDLVMIDDDLAWEPGSVRRLLSHDCDLVGGVYPKRQDDLAFPVRRKAGARVDYATGLMEVDLLPTGFLRMRRGMLEAMVKAHPHLAYRDANGPDLLFHALFWVELGAGFDAKPGDPLEIWGEDFTFCRRWLEMGGKVWRDTLLKFQHIGRKAWGGCYAETLPVAAMFETAA